MMYCLSSVSELKKPSMNDFLNRLEGCGWLKHIAAIIDTSAFIARVRMTSILSYHIKGDPLITFLLFDFGSFWS